VLENVVVAEPPLAVPIGSLSYWASVKVPAAAVPPDVDAVAETVPDSPLVAAVAVLVCGSGSAAVTLVTETGWLVTNSVCAADSPSVELAGVLSTVTW
jgi:hypothetical protein